MAPQPIAIIGTDAANCFEDLSDLMPKAMGTFPFSENPYDVLIDACGSDPARIQKAYETHRTTRNAQQRAKLLSPGFAGVIVDKTLQELEHVRCTRDIPELAGQPKRNPELVDPRNCLVFWARPTDAVLDLVSAVQEKLRELAPDIWLMPREKQHLTVLEITHSQKPEVIANLVAQIRPSLGKIVNWPHAHRTTLVKPMLSYDAAALAISFVPATDEDGSAYTYHHLRRDFYKLSVDSGVAISSRYMVPSAHITLARFVTTRDHAPGGEVGMEEWVENIESINRWLAAEWLGLRWKVGEERGIDCRSGGLWYGDGVSEVVGNGF